MWLVVFSNAIKLIGMHALKGIVHLKKMYTQNSSFQNSAEHERYYFK